uniref:Protein kinase domain-containing protein n=1 Tax=viral metagenome TaxID=1070528 RepID=A0A6C0EXW1_9ZZZZ
MSEQKIHRYDSNVLDTNVLDTNVLDTNVLDTNVLDTNVLDDEQEKQNKIDMENILSTYKSQISSGTDAKQFQYDYFAINKCTNQIDLKNILEQYIFKKPIKSNFILINIMKDAKRYHSAVNQYKTLSITNFVHLKATYWKEKAKFTNDLKFILEFMEQFNPMITDNIDKIENLQMTEFSDFTDSNIYIQDGPLACYCSHVRAMIFGYLHFEDYTVITEDDILISNTENISKYISMIPDDWDIICLNAMPINIKYEGPYYKFTDLFHSTHFYIIKNKVLPFLFANMYPIVDQVDILIAKLHNQINIYNIIDTVYQKNYSTNTQNNLYVILNSPNYKSIRGYLDELKLLLNNNINLLLPNNIENNGIITSNIIFDVIYNYIINNMNYIENNDNDIQEKSILEKSIIDSSVLEYNNIEDGNIDGIDYNIGYINDNSLLQNKRLFELIFIITNCSVKGINVTKKVVFLIKNINHIIESFNLHNTIDDLYNTNIKAYRYGSTANTYMCYDNIKNQNIIIKAYNSKLRWTCENHNIMRDIFNREIAILNELYGIPNTPQICMYDDEYKYIIKMTYLGESLYDKFILPDDWKEQIYSIFTTLTTKNIYYPEFNLKNIVVLDNKISFIDYGLAKFNSVGSVGSDGSDGNGSDGSDGSNDNTQNCNIFIELIELLNEKFKNIDDIHTRQVLYITFINNIRIDMVINNEDKYKNNIF